VVHFLRASKFRATTLDFCYLRRRTMGTRVFCERFDLRTRFEAPGCAFTAYRLWSKSLGILGATCLA
jgi:hypothetical protein